MEKTFLPPHDILHYVDKNDPRGPIPYNPTDDPQYENWESALLDWANREREKGNQISFEEPPSEYDDTILNPELAPSLDIVFPTENEVLFSRQIDIQITASAPRGISEVTYKIDGNSIGTSRDFPFNFSYYAKNLSRGMHNLKIIAVDDQGNASSKEINFDLQAEMDEPSADWFDNPVLSVYGEDFPRVVQIIPFRWDDIKEIKIYLSGKNISEKLIYTFNHDDKLFNNNLSLTWKHSPGTGFFNLRAEILDIYNKKTNKNLQVEVK